MSRQVLPQAPSPTITSLRRISAAMVAFVKKAQTNKGAQQQAFGLGCEEGMQQSAFHERSNAGCAFVSVVVWVARLSVVAPESPLSS